MYFLRCKQFRLNDNTLTFFLLKQVDDNETSSENSLPVDSVARDLATMHTICATHQSELRKQAETKVW